MFTTTRLVGDRALVQGTDAAGVSGQTTISTTEWDKVTASSAFKQAEQDFNSAVEEFFAPLTEAADKAGRKLERPDDPMAYIVEEEGTDQVPGKARQIHRLSRDSVILRMIDSGDVSRLLWVGEELEILEIVPGTTPPATNGTPSVDEIVG